jgi:hypothetical protein
MTGYLSRTFSRALNQLLLLFGGVLLLAFLLCVVAEQIRGAGTSVLGRGYYYAVAPGVVCHETGHALGCLLTGTKIVHFEPFKFNGDQLGHVIIESGDGNPLRRICWFLIGFGPIWFGCLIIWLLTKLFAKSCSLPDFDTLFPLDPLPSSRVYWWRALKTACRILKSVFIGWKSRPILKVVCLYLIFCIVSEMGLSCEDLSGMWGGFAYICCIFVLLNIVPMIGIAVSGWTLRFCRKLFPVHVLMLFVLVVDFMVVVIFVWPIKLIF